MQRISVNMLGILLTVVAAVFFGGFVLYGAWIDGRRQKVREQGKHPVTEPDGVVSSTEDESGG